VDDHRTPLDELARLVAVHEANSHITAGRAAASSAAVADHARSAVKLAPNDPRCIEFAAIALALAGCHDEAAVFIDALGDRRRGVAARLRGRANRGEIRETADYLALVRALERKPS
jgi:hypothetical protein